MQSIHLKIAGAYRGRRVKRQGDQHHEQDEEEQGLWQRQTTLERGVIFFQELDELLTMHPVFVQRPPVGIRQLDLQDILVCSELPFDDTAIELRSIESFVVVDLKGVRLRDVQKILMDCARDETGCMYIANLFCARFLV